MSSTTPPEAAVSCATPTGTVSSGRSKRSTATARPNGRLDASIGRYPAVLIYNGRPHVFYRDFTGGDLRHGYYNGQFWAFETLDGQGGSNGRIDADVDYFTDAVIYNGRPHVFYHDDDNGDLRHATYNGAAWFFEALDGAGGPNGRLNTNLGEYNAVVLYNGQMHVFYRHATNGWLRHAYGNGVAWGFETLDGNGGGNGRVVSNVGFYNSAILYNGRPHVFYYDFNGKELRHGYWNGVAWAFEILDGNGGGNGRTTQSVGRYPDALLYNGRPHVFYENGAMGHLRHGYWNGVAWAFEILDGNGGPNGRTTNDVGEYSGVVLYNGRPHVFYRNVDAGDLRHTYFG